MASPNGTSRYIPPARRKGAGTPPPDWFLREAIATFDLTAQEALAMMVIADNLNALGESRTSKSLLANRGHMSRQTATSAIDHLVALHLLLELDARAPGKMMRYAIPKFMPWHPN